VLQGTTAKELACSVTEAPSRAWIVMLKLGHETMLRETYPDQTSAVGRAGDLKDGLIEKGWTQVSGGPQFT
jgi:hypothetical protein